MKYDLFASDLVKEFFDVIKKNQYAVLRNYDQLPYNASSKDIDILILESEIDEVIIKLLKTAESLNYQLVWKNNLDYLNGFVFIKIKDQKIYSLKIDLFKGLKWRGFEYLDHKTILKSRERNNKFFIISKAHQIAVTIMNGILYGKKINKKYYHLFEKIEKKDINTLSRILCKSYSEKSVGKIIELIKNKEINKISNLRNDLIFHLIKQNIFDLVAYKKILIHLQTEYFYRSKFGQLIVFSGPDGAGKSSLIEDINNLFYELGINKNKIPHHFMTKKTPSIHKLFFMPKKYSKQDYTKPYQASPSGFFSSFFRVTYYFFAFIIDFSFSIKKELRGNHIIFFDRYFTDLIVDPTRMKISIKKQYVRFLFKRILFPNYIFFILADPKKILLRKPELTYEKLNKLNYEYRILNNSLKKSDIFLNNDEIEKNKVYLYQKIFNMLELNYKNI